MSDHAEYLSRRSFGSLDGIRCLSILAVLWHHADGGVRLGERLSTRGFLGVDMFFVLSGFLIVSLLLRERDRTQQISLKAFYARRTLRIMPLYYGVVLACVLLFGVLRRDGVMGEKFWSDLPYLLTYTTNWAPMSTFLWITWSLSAEEQFYLLWPPIQKYVGRPLAVLAVLIVLGQVVQFGLADDLLAPLGFGPDEPGMLRETTFTPILLGVLLAHLLHDARGYRSAARWLGGRYTPVVLGLCIVMACELMPVNLRGWPRPTLHLIMTALLASCVLREDHALAPLLRLAPVARIGVLSYGMYLLHMFVVDVVSRAIERGMPESWMFPVSLLSTLLVAELSFRFYETPFLRMKQRFAR